MYCRSVFQRRAAFNQKIFDKIKKFLRKLKKSLICIDKTAQMCVKYKYEIDLDTPLSNAYHVGVDFL